MLANTFVYYLCEVISSCFILLILGVAVFLERWKKHIIENVLAIMKINTMLENALTLRMFLSILQPQMFGSDM